MVAETSAYRLIFSEGDGLSGLTVDRYDRWLVVQFTSLALYHRRELLLHLLKEATGAEGMVVRTERGIAAKEGLKLGEESVVGSVPGIGCRHRREWIEVSRRPPRRPEDRVLLRPALEPQSRRELIARTSACSTCFCFTGAFSLNAIEHGGAISTLGVDSSWTAIERAREHDQAE